MHGTMTKRFGSQSGRGLRGRVGAMAAATAVLASSVVGVNLAPVVGATTPPPGNIETVAGGGTVPRRPRRQSGGLSASPEGVAVDAQGNLYFSDWTSNVVRKLSADHRTLTVVAGDGSSRFAGDGGAATAAELDYPTRVAVDGAGDLFIADRDNNRIRIVDTPRTFPQSRAIAPQPFRVTWCGDSREPPAI